jgi:vesicular inhibitory amino acid transporter
MHATLLGVAVVFVLMASEIIQQLLHDIKIHISFCYWMIIIVAFLTPFTWLGSPKDMW